MFMPHIIIITIEKSAVPNKKKSDGTGLTRKKIGETANAAIIGEEIKAVLYSCFLFIMAKLQFRSQALKLFFWKWTN